MSIGRDFKLLDAVQLQIASLRGVSALVVMCAHGMQIFIYPRHPYAETYAGFFSQSAVMMFFILSGFLIGRSIIINIDRNGYFDCISFGAGRLRRLLPPLCLAIILVIILSLLAPHFFPSGTRTFLTVPNMSFVRTEFALQPISLVGALLFVNGFVTVTPTPDGPLWSLPYEFWYYVIAAALFMWSTKPIMSISIILFAFYIVCQNEHFFVFSVIWILGFIIAVAHYNDILSAKKIALSLFPISAFLLLYATSMASTITATGQQWTTFCLVTGLWFGAYLGLILLGRAKFPKWFSWAAPFSYTLYVTHFPIMLFAFGITQASVAGSTRVAIGVAIVAAAISLSFAVSAARIVERKHLFWPAQTRRRAEEARFR